MGNNSWTHPPLFFATSGPTKRRKHYFCLLFSQYWVGVETINVLGTSPSNQFRDYFIWNRIEKLMPQHWNCSPQILKTLKQLTNLFSNLDFLPKSGFPKTLDLSKDFPGIFWAPVGRALLAGLSWHLFVNLDNRVVHKNCFFHNSG